jgi:integrase
LETVAQDRYSKRQTDWAERDLALILTALLAGLRAEELCQADVGDIRTTDAQLVTEIRIQTRCISSASPLLTSRVAGPNSVREAREASPGFAVFMIEGIVCRRNAVGLGVWMFVRDHIDGGEGVRSEATRARSDASTGKGKVQQRLEGCADCSGEGAP